MTKEEAINKWVMPAIKNTWNEKKCGEIIEALKQEPSNDVIGRKEVMQFVSYIQSIKDNHNTEGTPINYGTICDLVIRGWKLVEVRDEYAVM